MLFPKFYSGKMCMELFTPNIYCHKSQYVSMTPHCSL